MRFTIRSRATHVAVCALLFGGAATASAQQPPPIQLDLTGVYDVSIQCATIKNAVPSPTYREWTAEVLQVPDEGNTEADVFGILLYNNNAGVEKSPQALLYNGEVQVSNVVREFIASDTLDDVTRAQGYANACLGTFVDPEGPIPNPQQSEFFALGYGEAIIVDAFLKVQDNTGEVNAFSGVSTYGTSARPTRVGAKPSPVEFGTCTYRFVRTGDLPQAITEEVLDDFDCAETNIF